MNVRDSGHTLLSSPVPSPPALRVEYVVLDLVTLSRIGARGLLLYIGMTMLYIDISVAFPEQDVVDPPFDHQSIS
jgi:hypothetical protein